MFKHLVSKRNLSQSFTDANKDKARDIFREYVSSVSKMGAAAGGIWSCADAINVQEPNIPYKYGVILPTYVAGGAAFGGVIGATTALFWPLSIVYYFYTKVEVTVTKQ